jgi:hypothetical protein
MRASDLRNISLMILVGTALVLLLGQLGRVDDSLQAKRHVSPVFEPVRSKTLTDGNLVDAMARLSFGDRLLRVQWDHGILSLDLSVSEPEAAWNDAKALIALAFLDKRNVNQILIRMFQGRREDARLLLALETRKTDWTEEELGALDGRQWNDMAEPDAKIRSYVTPAGRKQNFAN